MHRPAKWSLKKKFSLILAVIFLPIFLMISFFQYRLEYFRRIEVETEKMRLVALTLTQNWDVLRGKEGRESLRNSKSPMEYFDLSFQHNAEIKEKILRETPFIFIRYVSLIPRNPNNKADSFEQAGIHFLEQGNDLDEYLELSRFQGEKAIRYLKPLRREDLCLPCHVGRQNKAMAFPPPNLKKIGFQKQEIQGAISIAIPTRSFLLPLWQGRKRFFLMHVGLFGFMILIWVIFSKFFILDRLSQLAVGMASITAGNKFKEEALDIYQDEIGSLFSVFHQMNKSIHRKMLSFQEERDIYRGLTQLTLYGIFAFDGKGEILFFNEGAARIFGWEKEEILKQNVVLLISPKFRNKYARFMKRYLGEHNFEKKEGGIFEDPIETVGLRKNGEEFTISLSMAVGKSSGSKIFTAIVQDITEQKTKEGEIIRQNEKLVLLNHVSTELIGQRDLKKLAEDSLYESLDLTDSFCGLFLLQNKDGDLVPLASLGLTGLEEETSQLFKPIGVLGEIVRQKQPRIINTSARRINRTVLSWGKFSFYSFLGVPIIADQEVIGVICVANRAKGYTDKEQEFLTSLVNDISLLIVRNAVEKETQILEEKFRTLFDQSSDMIVICNREGGILTVNHRVIQCTGYSYQQLIEHELWKLYLPSEGRGCKEFLKQVWAKGFSRLESFFRQKGGGAFPVDIQANTVIFGNQKVIQVVIRDIAHLKKGENDLKNRLESLKKQLEERGKELLFFNKAMNNLPEHVIFTDRRGRLFFVNKSFCERFGYVPQELIGQSFEVLFHTSVSVHTIDEMIDQASEGCWQGRAVYTTKEAAQRVQVELVIKAVQSPQGGVLGLLGVSVEVEGEKSLH